MEISSSVPMFFKLEHSTEATVIILSQICELRMVGEYGKSLLSWPQTPQMVGWVETEALHDLHKPEASPIDEDNQKIPRHLGPLPPPQKKNQGGQGCSPGALLPRHLSLSWGKCRQKQSMPRSIDSCQPLKKAYPQ